MGLGMLGIVGWSVVVPALLGALLGRWLDKKYPESFSWTLTLLMTGVYIGGEIAWRWLDKEQKKITENNKDNEQ
jgi:ATP synthase protein I